jgi:hypothetical protein
MTAGLVVIGTGAEPGDRSLSRAAVHHVQHADRVLYLTDTTLAHTVRGLRSDAESLRYVFEAAASLRHACLAVAEEVLSWVRIGHVVAAVFAGLQAREPAHLTAAIAAADDLPTTMLPALSHTAWLTTLPTIPRTTA